MNRQELVLKWKREYAEKLWRLAEASEMYDRMYKEFTKKDFLEFCEEQKIIASELYFFRKYNGMSICPIGSLESLAIDHVEVRRRVDARKAFKESMQLYNATKHGDEETGRKSKQRASIEESMKLYNKLHGQNDSDKKDE